MGDKEKKSCYNCVYKGSVAGSAHISCGYNFTKAGKPFPEGDEHGVKNGWYIFPVCYDPVWMIDKCEGFSTEVEPEMRINPLASLILLSRR